MLGGGVAPFGKYVREKCSGELGLKDILVLVMTRVVNFLKMVMCVFFFFLGDPCTMLTTVIPGSTGKNYVQIKT